MLQEEDYSSDSDDEDFIPDGADGKSDDSEISGNDCEDEGDEGNEVKSKTKKGSRAKKKKRNPLLSLIEDETNVVEDNKLEDNKLEDKSIQLKKAKEDDLWSDFLADVDDKPAPKPKPKSNSWGSLLGYSKKSPSTQDDQPKKDVKLVEKPTPVETKPSTVKVTKVYEFAGEEVRVEKEVSSDSAEAKAAVLKESINPNSGAKRKVGISGIANFLDSKKEKLSTFQKTQIDWFKFKKDEDITEELEVHKKSKAGYLDKQEFLQRADLREYEIERDMRMNKRSKR